MEPLGTHLLLDLWQISRDMLDDPESLEQHFVTAAVRGGARVVEVQFHRFKPHGISGVVILKESHLTIHSWPELGYAAVDVFTCGCAAVAEAIADEIIAVLEPGEISRNRIDRGLHAVMKAV